MLLSVDVGQIHLTTSFPACLFYMSDFILQLTNKNLPNNKIDYNSLSYCKAFNESVQREYIAQIDEVFSSLPWKSGRNMSKCVAPRKQKEILVSLLSPEDSLSEKRMA